MRTRGAAALLPVSLAVILILWSSAAAAAQRGRPRAYRAARPVVFVGLTSSPFFYPSFGSFWWGYPYVHPHYHAGFYGPYPFASDARSAVRLQVTPRNTEVFVDGYAAGIADEFDGVFQRLPLPPGEHEIVLFLEGYRTVRQKVYLTPGATYRIRHVMEPLPEGEASEPRPQPPASPPPAASPAAGAPDTSGRAAVRPDAAVSRFGTLSIRVQPDDADVFIDGERWRGPSPTERLVVQVTAGVHRVEIRKSGFDTFSTEIEVPAGETTSLNVSLLRQEQ